MWVILSRIIDKDIDSDTFGPPGVQNDLTQCLLYDYMEVSIPSLFVPENWL